MPYSRRSRSTACGPRASRAAATISRPITQQLLAAGQGDFTIDQQPYLQGFIPTLELFLYQASKHLSGIADVDTGLKFLDKKTVVPYNSTKSRYEGTKSTPGVS